MKKFAVSIILTSLLAMSGVAALAQRRILRSTSHSKTTFESITLWSKRAATSSGSTPSRVK
jgi:hypothetical protein